MTNPRHTKAPGAQTEGNRSNPNQADQDSFSLADFPTIPALSADEAAAALDGQLAVFVVGVDRRGLVRRRAYLNVPSATAAVRRATEAGKPAHAMLVRLLPVGAVMTDG